MKCEVPLTPEQCLFASEHHSLVYKFLNENHLPIDELAKRVSKQQMNIVHLKSCGYNNRDIARRQNTTMKRVQELLEEVHSVLLEICYG